MATSKMQEKLESLEGRIKEIAYASSKNEKMQEKKYKLRSFVYTTTTTTTTTT